jgi:hypothetical protein
LYDYHWNAAFCEQASVLILSSWGKVGGAEKIEGPFLSFLRPIFTMTVWARQSGVLILAGARVFLFFETVQIGCGAHHASSLMDTKVVPQNKVSGAWS